MSLLGIFRRGGAAENPLCWLELPQGPVPLHLVPNRRARRYILRLLPNAAVRVTIPRGGNQAEAVGFAERCRPWIALQLLRQVAGPRHPQAWQLGTTILFRGDPTAFEAVDGVAFRVRLGSELIPVSDTTGNFRADAERHLRRIATRELPARVAELATVAGFTVQRVSVRNQRSRWGSCSRRGTLSLNWRLVQAPPSVRDYIIYHELAHLREMNHSPRFWALVRTLCPDYQTAERWLKTNSHLLR